MLVFFVDGERQERTTKRGRPSFGRAGAELDLPTELTEMGGERYLHNA